MVYPDLKFFTFKTKKDPHFFLRLEADYTQDICKKFIEINFCLGYMVFAEIASVPTLNIFQILMRFAKVKTFQSKLLYILITYKQAGP